MAWRGSHYVVAGGLAVGGLLWAAHEAWSARRMVSARPLVVTEAGIATATPKRRAENIVRELEAIARARDRGADIRGYYHWSLIDNFEWIKGFGPRFGLVHVDYETFKRTPRASAQIYRQIIAAHTEGNHALAPQLSKLQGFQAL